MNSSKTYRVCFTATSTFKIDVTAASEAQAIAKAKRLWHREGEAAFTCFAGSAHDWMAMEAD